MRRPDESRVSESELLKCVYYQLLNSAGQPVTGNGYESMEHIEPSAGNDTSDGEWVPTEGPNGTEIHDQVGYVPPAPPGDSIGIVFQTFSIRYQGVVVYEPSTVLVHIVEVNNGNLTTRVVPLGWFLW